jgi:hypothetical protein
VCWDEGIADRKLLRIYLNDHLATASAGAALARRALRSNAGSELGRFLEALAADLEEDLASIQSVMRELDLRPSVVKRSLGVVGERLGRLKLNGRIVSYSPLSRLAELEGLSLLVAHNACLWRTLETLGVERAEGLAERAEGQIEALRRHRLDAALLAFTPEAVE